MLKALSIKNFAIIDDINIEFKNGLTVITGETGAGKSIIVGALSLLLGEKNTNEFIRKGNNTCYICAVFDIKGNNEVKQLLLNKGFDNIDELIIKREISKDGSQKNFINEIPSSLSFLKSISKRLVDIHGQHLHQRLLDNAEQLLIIDLFGELSQMRSKIIDLYNALLKSKKELERLRQTELDRKNQIELLRFQIEEIDGFSLSSEREKQIERDYLILKNAQKILEYGKSIYGTLYENEDALINKIGYVKKYLERIVELDATLKKNYAKLEKAELLVDEISEEISSYLSNIDYTPDKLDEIMKLKDKLDNLKSKYGPSVKDILDYLNSAKEKLQNLSKQQNDLTELENKVFQLEKEYKKLCFEISKKRQSISKELEKKVEQEFENLNLKRAKFKIKIEEQNFLSTGKDKVEFMFCANPGEDLKPLSKIISGGELSRVMLALKKVFANKDKTPTLIFDEIDIGIGGKTASTVGEELRSISAFHQVIVITHLPQIASLADFHYFVDKRTISNRTVTYLLSLNKQQRVKEIARMLAGDKITKTTLSHAKQMLCKVH